MTKEVVALDCEMVGIGPGGIIDLLARVSVVDKHGQLLYDSFVKPRDNVRIMDYRTNYSGVRPQDLVNAPAFEVVQSRVKSLIQGRVLVGHSIVEHDLPLLKIPHPSKDIRDTATYPPFRRYARANIRSLFVPQPKLRVLSERLLGQSIQQGEHDSIEDAKTAMKIYMLHRTEWERSLGTA